MFYVVSFLIGGFLGVVLTNLFKGCKHDWCVIRDSDILNERRLVVGFFRICECKKCKKIKQDTVSLN
jgi:hypothetical protein